MGNLGSSQYRLYVATHYLVSPGNTRNWCYDTQFIFRFSLFNQLYYYCSHLTDDFTFTYHFCSPTTHSDSLPIHYCDSVLVLLFRDSLWLPYYMLTQDESFTVRWLTMSCSLIVYNSHCLHDSLFSNYYKYRHLWTLGPQTWLLVSYGTTANTSHLSSLCPKSHLFKVFLISPLRLQRVTTRHQKLR